jgi:two-component system, chemotaxis family, chemotaxis protein CheY
MATSILLIDDSRAAQHIFQRYLEHSDEFKLVGIASDGAEGIRLFAELKPTIVCLDILMPDLDGIQVLRTLKSLNTNVRVIIVTSLGSDADRVVEFLKTGAVSVLSKPFDAATLLDQLRRVAQL